MSAATLEWLFERVHPVPFSGCWLWAGALNSNGYARIKVRGRKFQAHRVSYELKYGPIPVGLQMDHLCRVPCCINPDHLEPVTPQTNVLRSAVPALVARRNQTPLMRVLASGRAKARNARMRDATHCKRGHEFTPENAFIPADGRRRCRLCIKQGAARRLAHLAP